MKTHLKERKEENITKALKLTKFSLELYNFNASLCLEMLEYLGKQSSEKPFEVNKCVAYLLLNRLTGLAQSIKTLVLKGYYYEASILERSFWEAIGLCSYLSSNIPEAKNGLMVNGLTYPKISFLNNLPR